jgi:hypothetical protein
VTFFNTWNVTACEAVGDLAAAFSKIEGYAARLALIHHVVTTAYDPSPSPVSAESMAAGIMLAEWFGREAERVYGILAQTSGDGEVEWLLGRIRENNGQATPREVMFWNRKRYPTADLAEHALRKLSKYGRWVTPPSGPKGGRPSGYFELYTVGGKPPDDETQEEREARWAREREEWKKQPYAPG